MSYHDRVLKSLHFQEYTMITQCFDPCRAPKDYVDILELKQLIVERFHKNKTFIGTR